MWKEFKEFLQRGNVIDLAVAVVVGAAFGASVNSFVNDILMPPIGLALGALTSRTCSSISAGRGTLHSPLPRRRVRRRSTTASS